MNPQEFESVLIGFKNSKTEEEMAAYEQEQTERIDKQSHEEELDELKFILERLKELKKEVLPISQRSI